MRFVFNAYNYNYRVTAASPEEARERALELSARWHGIVTIFEERDGGTVRLGAVWVRKSESQSPVLRPRSGTKVQLALF